MSQKMHVGDTDLRLQAAFSKLGSSQITSMSWSSSATGVATVTAVGDGEIAVLHAVGAGDTNITLTATRASGANLTHVLAVTVWAAPGPEVKILVHPSNSAGFASAG